MQGILIHMPRDQYDSFVAKCDPWTRQYTVLKNAIIYGRPIDGYAELLCTVPEANGLLDTAEHVYPKVAPHIKDAIAAPRDS
jgi:hypothetical protein